MREAVRLIRECFNALGSGQALNQPRRRLVLPTQAVLHQMAGACGNYFGTKIYSSHPRGGVHFLYLLYRAEDAAPLACFEANWLGQIRTGAATGAATDLLARPDAATLGIVGSGFQARSQLEAILAVRQIQRVHVWSRDERRRGDFALHLSAAFGVPVVAVKTAQEAVEGMDLVTTATSSRDPVLLSEWIGSGVHVNAMGSNQAARRELPEELLWRASCIAVDSLEQARIEAGDLLLARPGIWQRTELRELGAIASGAAPGRTAPEDLTIFKSLGLAVQDTAVAGFLYEEALRAGHSRSVPLFDL